MESTAPTDLVGTHQLVTHCREQQRAVSGLYFPLEHPVDRDILVVRGSLEKDPVRAHMGLIAKELMVEVT